MILLDTDIVVDVVRKNPPAVQWLTVLGANPIAISGFTEIELLAGCRSSLEQQKLTRTLQTFEVIWLSQHGCNHAVANYRSLHLRHGIGAFDAFIAQTAVEQGVPLQTFN